MSTLLLRSGLVSMLLVAITVCDASAQCDTCATPTVAYAPVTYTPVVAQPTVAYRPYTGWYPGKMLDQWRLRRAAKATPAYTAAYAPAYSAAYAPTYTASYAPSYTANYTAAYAPTYTAAYAPASYTTAYSPTYTAAYRPYVTSYAPLSVPVSTGCNTCTQTVARPVLMQPVVASACDTCSYTPSCGCDSCSSGGCSSCSSGVGQAVYSEAPACSGCAAGGTVSNVVPPSNSGLDSVGPPTGQPSFEQVPEAAPPQSQYQSDRPIQGGDSNANEVDPLDEYDPGPAEPEADPSTWYNAPQLLDPSDRTANRTYKSRQPTVDVRTAVYRNQGQNLGVSATKTRRARTQAEIDADGWSSVPSNR